MPFALHQVKRRLGNKHVPAHNERLHVSKEERQQQRSDVAAVDVGVSHNNYLAVTQLIQVELVIANPRAKGGDNRLDFGKIENLIEASFFDVEDFSTQRQDSLRCGVSALLGRATRRIAFDQKNFGRIAVLRSAVR